MLVTVGSSVEPWAVVQGAAKTRIGGIALPRHEMKKAESPALARPAGKEERSSEADGLPPNSIKLTEHELEIPKRYAEGCLAKEIAGQLNISIRTVENRLQGVYRKLGVSNGREAERWYFDHYLHPGEKKTEGPASPPEPHIRDSLA